MSFKDDDLKFKNRYNSAYDDIVSDFYNVALSEAVRYDRITGFFNSTSLAIASRGISEFIKNNGHMRIICGVNLDPNDVESIKNADELKDLIDTTFLEDLDSIEDELIKNYVNVLGWMVANNYLEIKIGINRKNNAVSNHPILHSKIGILYDEFGDSILFDGSVNETANGWKNNIESLKVFKSWKNFEFMAEDIKDFEDFWNNKIPSLDIFDIPEASKRQLIKRAPKSKEDVERLLAGKSPKLRQYQETARTKWINNGYRGIFSMATGTGKTYTALSCFDYLKKRKKGLLTVIVCPQKHLISQWEKSLTDLGFNGETLIASGDYKWKSKLISLIGDLEGGSKNHVVVFTTFNTFSKDKFLDRLDLFDGESLLIIDEVHGIGAVEYRKGLFGYDYNYRLGLSATPDIKDDYERTELVENYFEGIVFSYDLKTAIDKGFLTHYDYHPIFIDLKSEELELYKEYTYKIANIIRKQNKSITDEKSLQGLLKKRKDVINNAEDKFSQLKRFLNDHPNIKDLIIYCTGEQLPGIQNLLNKLDISNQKFTGEESTKKIDGKSERDSILELFSKGHYRCLVGIKCLDEGVDVPSTQNAFLMASTLNSRQHIQRRGRILRKSPGKLKANIYDLIVFPNIKNESDSIKRILKNEQARYDEYADLADNYAKCSKLFIEKWESIS